MSASLVRLEPDSGQRETLEGLGLVRVEVPLCRLRAEEVDQPEGEQDPNRGRAPEPGAQLVADLEPLPGTGDVQQHQPSVRLEGPEAIHETARSRGVG